MSYEQNKFSPNPEPRHNSRMRRRLGSMTNTMVPLATSGKENQRRELRKHGKSPKYSGKRKCFFI